MIRFLVALGIGSASLAAAFWPASPPHVLILAGDTNGNLAPCGCTKPMTGGIKRRVTAARALGSKLHATLLDNGGWVTGTGRQDQLKAEALAETLGKAGWHAINVGPSEAKLGAGELLALQSLAEGKLLSSGLRAGDLGFLRFLARGPFLVMGLASKPAALSHALGRPSAENAEVLAEGVAQAQEAGLAPILLLQGSLEEAAQIARDFPALRLIQYRSGGAASERPHKVGRTWLVTPGADGKQLLRLVYSSGQFRDYRAVALGPEFQDDPSAARTYRDYLQRVSEERLLEAMPRLDATKFAGNAACTPCHSDAQHVWKTSLHAKALTTLQKRAHDRDPDCLPCHVIGLNSSQGYRSPKATPQLAFVGCESCHGSGVEHVLDPAVPLPRKGSRSCASCHTGNTSPGFKFSTYWQRIQH